MRIRSPRGVVGLDGRCAEQGLAERGGLDARTVPSSRLSVPSRRLHCICSLTKCHLPSSSSSFQTLSPWHSWRSTNDTCTNNVLDVYWIPEVHHATTGESAGVGASAPSGADAVGRRGPAGGCGAAAGRGSAQRASLEGGAPCTGLSRGAAKPAPGRPPKLTAKQRAQLERLLLKGAEAAGFATPLWTCPRIATVIERHFQVRYHVDHIGRVLHALGWSPQQPTRRAIERDEVAIAQWVKDRWPVVRKRRAPQGRADLH